MNWRSFRGMRMHAKAKSGEACGAPNVQAVLAICFLSAVALLLVVYLWAASFLGNGSDNASIILEGRAMLRGNITLHGWYLPPDSFITTEMPLDAILSIVFTGSQLLKVTPALLYATAVCCAAYLAGRRVKDPAQQWLSMGACIALLAFPVGILFPLVLRSPFHIGTIVASLFAWWAYDRFVGDPTSRVALVLFVAVTALAILGDPLAEVLIPAPVCIVSAWRLARSGGKDTAAWSALGGAVVALLLGIGLFQLLIITGTHTGTARLTLSPPELIWRHVQWLWLGICALFHIDVLSGLKFDLLLPLEILNAAFLVLSLVGFAKLFLQSLLPTDMRDSLSNVLSWAIVCSIAAFIFTDFASDVEGIRYVVPAFFYAGILSSSALRLVVPVRLQRGTVLALLATSALTFGVTLASLPRAPAAGQPLVTFLESHHLTTGLGEYWVTNITTLGSDGRIRLIPIQIDEGCNLRAYRWHADEGWFKRDTISEAQFVVLDGGASIARYEACIEREFGVPSHLYHVNQYVVLTYDHPFVTPAIALE